MTWHETHIRWKALREVEAAADRDPTGTLPWTAEYAEIFGDRSALVAALRYRWKLVVEAQLDSHLTDAALDDRQRELTQRHAGLLRVLQRHDREDRRLAHAS